MPETEGTNLQATFSVNDIKVKVENTTASVKTEEQTTDATETNDNANNTNEAQQ